jgi:hypothetical protein
LPCFDAASLLQTWGGGFAKLPSFEFTWVYTETASRIVFWRGPLFPAILILTRALSLGQGSKKVFENSFLYEVRTLSEVF